MLDRILIVDDDANHRTTVALALRLDGFEVLEAQGGEQALGLLETEAVDLALVDLMMPGINGLELARRLRSSCPGVCVVLTSAYALSARQIEGAGVDAAGFVPKPCCLDELASFLRSKLAARRAAAAAIA